MPPYLPAADSLLARKYSIGTLELKVQNKTALQKEVGWAAEPRRPMLCLPAGMTEKLGGTLLTEILPGILSLEAELLVLGKGSAAFGALFTKLAKEQSYRVHIVSETEEARHRMYAATDMALFLADPADTQELEIALRYGVVPISPPSALLQDYNPVQETGNAFVFDPGTSWLAFAALVRAAETYKFPFDWRTIQRHCMETVHRNEKAVFRNAV